MKVILIKIISYLPFPIRWNKVNNFSKLLCELQKNIEEKNKYKCFSKKDGNNYNEDKNRNDLEDKAKNENIENSDKDNLNINGDDKSKINNKK